MASYCPAHHVLFYKQLQAKVAGVEVADMLRAMWARVAPLKHLERGATLVMCEGVTSESVAGGAR